MALNKEVFKTRSLTALVFVAVMLVGLFWNFWSFLILFTVIHFGCWYEFVKLMKKIHGNKFLRYCLLGLVYITMPVLMMIDLGINIPMNNQPQLSGAYFKYPAFISLKFLNLFPVIIIFSIWINDTMAYIVGSIIGKTPFSKISPKKTWEGTLGGIVLCIIVIGFLFRIAMKNQLMFVTVSRIHWFAIAAICAVCGTAGDLLESKIKRMANVKDSGTFMPGHGGFLDRFDSLLIATPFVWMYVKLFL